MDPTLLLSFVHSIIYTVFCQFIYKMLGLSTRPVSLLQGGTRLPRLIGVRFFGKRRVIVDDSLKDLTSRPTNYVELNPYNKIRVMSKRSYLPVSHISKALCTRDNGDFLLKVQFLAYCKR